VQAGVTEAEAERQAAGSEQAGAGRQKRESGGRQAGGGEGT